MNVLGLVAILTFVAVLAFGLAGQLGSRTASMRIAGWVVALLCLVVLGSAQLLFLDENRQGFALVLAVSLDVGLLAGTIAGLAAIVKRRAFPIWALALGLPIAFALLFPTVNQALFQNPRLVGLGFTKVEGLLDHVFLPQRSCLDLLVLTLACGIWLAGLIVLLARPRAGGANS